MKFCLKCVALLVMAVLAAGQMAVVCADEYYGSYPASDIYMVQSQKHTCTLIAATMMLRNYSYQLGSPYEQVTDSAVRRHAWTQKYGLSHSFAIGSVAVECSTEIQEAYDKKAYLIMCLKLHEEGVVIYDTGAPHAIWLFGYDAQSDTFYCADTISGIGGKAIPLEESIIKGETQADKINTIDKIWYVV